MPIDDTQMYTHKFDGVKSWFGDWIIDFTAKLSSNVTIVVHAGRCVSLNASGQFETGCVGAAMPLFINNTGGSGAPSSGNRSANGYWHAMHAATLSGVTANNGFEAETTEFDPARTYLPNQQLRAIVANTNQTTGGRLTNEGVVRPESASPQLATAVVGVVSKPPAKTDFTQPSVLAFWMTYKPGADGL